MTLRNTFGKFIFEPHTLELVEPLIYTASLLFLILKHPCANRCRKYSEVSILISQ